MELVMIVIIVLAVVGLVVMLMMGGSSSQTSRRLEALETDRQKLFGDLGRKGDDTALSKRQKLGGLRATLVRFNLLRGRQAQSYEQKLSRGGIRNKDAVVIFIIAKFALMALFGTFAVLVFFVSNAITTTMFWSVVWTIGLTLFGWFMPDLYVKNEGDKRRLILQKGMPDALDLLVICAEAGMSLDQSLDRVARELSLSWPTLAEELAVTRIELTFLPERHQALRNFAKRVDLPAARGVVTTLLQSEKFGTSLAQSLRVLAHEFRKERLMRAEEKAARLPATMTVPLILFILPVIMVVLIGPAAIIVRQAGF